MKINTICLLMIFTVSVTNARDQFNLLSPDSSIRISVILSEKVYYNLEVDGTVLLDPSPIFMSTNQGVLGHHPVVIDSEETHVKGTISTVWGIRSEISEEYNQLEIAFKGGYSLVFRAYNEGVAYRFSTDLIGELIVFEECVEYRFKDNHTMVNHVVDSYTTSYEKLYTRQNVKDIRMEDLVCLPSLVIADNVKLAILEADLYEYPGMYLSKRSAHPWNRVSGKFANFPIHEEPGGTRHFNMVVRERADYIARTKGTRDFPWRVVQIARNDFELLDSDLVFKLSRPVAIDTDWIRPGKVAWDWWNALNLEGVDFPTGVNTASYQYFIDFAAENGISYVILDEWWSDQFDLMLPSKDLDMEFLTRYAKEKGVGLILWAVGHTIDRQRNQAFELFRKWGIAGIKVDFINRDDQLAIQFYEDFAREAARYQLLVNFHGCSKPTGVHRVYPNLINYEGVRGNEYNMFSEQPNPPRHNLDIAFIRMLAGPMDYTPGAMNNAIKGEFHNIRMDPMSYGTRCHQLGMYVVYYSPLQMLCDAPTQYEKYPDILEFLSNVPTTWDETVSLEGKVGEYAVIARRKGNDWYIGGLNDWNERNVTINLSQFVEGNFSAIIFRDGVNADRRAEDYLYEEQDVDSKTKMNIVMKSGGGFAIVLKAIERFSQENE